MERRLAAILSYDAVNYSGALSRDESATLAGLRSHRREVIEPAIQRHHGRLIKFTGDGALVEFPSAVDAVLFALALQDGVARRNETLPGPARLIYRVGISIGDVVVEDGDVYGDGVNIAVRIEALAEPGGICIHRNVRDHLPGRADLSVEDLGTVEVKNITAAVHVCRVIRDEKAAALLAAAAAPARARPAGQMRWRAMVAAAVVLVLAAGFGWWLQPWRQADGPWASGQPSLPLPEKPSIAVLPFANLSNDPAQDYFADGFADEIVTALSKFSALFVISSESSFRYRGDKQNLVAQAANDLGVKYVITGTVQKQNERFKINVRLINASTGQSVWAESFDEVADDIFGIQSRITRMVAGQIGSMEGGVLAREELNRISKTRTVNLKAYDFVLKGELHRTRETREDSLLAKQMFERAIELDPHFAKAHAGLSLVHQDEVSGGWTADREKSLESALASAQKAIELDPTEPLGYMALGLLYQYYADNERAIPQLERAHELNPNNFRYMWALGYALAYAGDAARAVELLDTARRVNPYHPEALLRALGQANFFAGRYEQAILELGKITRRHRTSFWLYFAASHAMLGNNAEAQAAISEALTLDPDLRIESEISRRVANGLSQANALRLREALLRAGLPT